MRLFDFSITHILQNLERHCDSGFNLNATTTSTLLSSNLRGWTWCGNN